MNGSGSPAFEGTKPPSPQGTADQLEGEGVKPGQNGINAKTGKSSSSEGNNSATHADATSFIKTADKLTYGYAANVEVVLGWKNTVVAGMKTAIDVAFAFTHNFSSYTTLFGGVRYEIIRGTKTETVQGWKEDVAKPGQKIDWSNGPWTHKATQRKKMQADFEKMCKGLAEEFGGKLDETTKVHKARIDSYEEHVKSETNKYTTSLMVDANALRCSLDQMQRELGLLEQTTGEFTRKMASMDAAADAALNIRTPSAKIKGSMIEIKGSVQKFMGSLVKLGE